MYPESTNLTNSPYHVLISYFNCKSFITLTRRETVANGDFARISTGSVGLFLGNTAILDCRKTPWKTRVIMADIQAEM